MLLHLYTPVYFDGEADNAADPVLALVPSDRRATLIAVREPGNGNAVYRFDIHLQGDTEDGVISQCEFSKPLPAQSGERSRAVATLSPHVRGQRTACA